MGWFERLWGGRRRGAPAGWPRRVEATPAGADAQALERYRYLVRTAPPEALEEMHREAFTRMTPAQRQVALRALGAAMPPTERRLLRDDPGSLARLATRAELMRPGTVVNVLGGPGVGMGMGMGGLFAGSLLSSLVGSVVGSMVAHELLDGFHSGHEGWGEPDAAADTGLDAGAGEVDPVAYGDSGVEADDWGGDFGGDGFGADVTDEL